MMNKLLIFLLISLIGILITSCPSTENGNDDPENGNPITKSISGTIHDSYSAEPVSGVSVSFGDTSTTTDGTGAFTLTITQTPVNGKLKDTFIMYGEGYQFLYIEELSIDIEKTYDIDIPISPQNFGGYTMKELTGDIFYSDGTTEISMFSSPVINIFNGIENYNMNPLYIDSYLIDTPISGNDCLITGYADLDPNPLIFTEVGVDLSGTSPITIDITEPAPASIDTIAVNYDSAGNTAYSPLPFTVPALFYKFKPKSPSIDLLICTISGFNLSFFISLNPFSLKICCFSLSVNFAGIQVAMNNKRKRQVVE